MKDDFTIHVFDAERGCEARELDDLSGGEKVIVEEALRNGIALMMSARYQHPLRTMFRDETTGALDADNAGRYIAMLRRVQEIGGYDKVFFVTHSAGCAQMADAQLVIADGQVEVRLPPFVEPRNEVA